MFERVTTPAVKGIIWLFWLVLLIGSGALHFASFAGNCVGTAQAFVSSGYSNEPIGSDPIIGRFIGPFVGSSATISSLYAVVLCAVISGALFMFVHFSLLCAEQWLLKREFERSGQEQEYLTTARKLARNIVIAGLLLVPLAICIAWDIRLFQFRSKVAALHLDNSDTAATSVPDAVAFQQMFDGLDVADLIMIGCYGYLACSVLCSVLSELCGRKAMESWEELQASLEPQPAYLEAVADGAVDGGTNQDFDDMQDARGAESDASRFYDDPEASPTIEIDPDHDNNNA